MRLGGVLRAAGIERDDMQIIAPTNREIGIINTFFHQLALTKDPNLWPGAKHIAEGEPVIWTQNDLQRGLTNGAWGRIVSIDGDRVEAVLDGVEYQLSADDVQYVQLVYASSVHKAQGSQWSRVIIPTYRTRLWIGHWSTRL